MNVSLAVVVPLGLFLLGGILVAIMVTLTQRAYKKDEQSDHWVVYPSAMPWSGKGDKAELPEDVAAPDGINPPNDAKPQVEEG